MNENATHGSPLSDGPAPHRSLTNLDPKPTRLSFSTAVRRIAWGLVFALAAWVTWKGFTSEPARETLRFDSYNTTFGLTDPPQNEFATADTMDELRAWIGLIEGELDSEPLSANRCLESISLLFCLAEIQFSPFADHRVLCTQAAARVWERMHRIAPNDPRLWRTLALSEPPSHEIAELFPEWGQSSLEQFAEVVRHDPQNSLYQYLAAPALQEVTILVKLDELIPRSPMSPSDLSRIRAARALREHFAQLPKDAPLIISADDRVSVFRALGWIQHDNAKRRELANRLYPFIAFTQGDARVLSLLQQPDLAEFRRQWELATPRSPTFDYLLKQLAATNEELAKSRRNREIAISPVPAPSSESKLNLLISEAALKRVDELRGLNSTSLPWITSLTRNRLLVIGLCLVVLGASGGLFRGLPLRRKLATTVPFRFSGIPTFCAAVSGMTLAAILILLNVLDDIESGVEIANECVVWLPTLGFGLLEMWLVRRILGSRLAITRRVRAGIMIIAVGIFIGWNLLYQSVISAAKYDFVAEFSDVFPRSRLAIRRDDKYFVNEYWDYEISRVYVAISDGPFPKIPWPRVVVSQGLPFGFALSGLTLTGAALTFTPGAGGRSVWNWVWGTKLRMNSPSEPPGGSWAARVALETFRGWRILGTSALILWLAATASAMLTAESQDRRAFGSEATAEVLWNDYITAIEEIRADAALMERLRHPEPLGIGRGLIRHRGSE